MGRKKAVPKKIEVVNTRSPFTEEEAKRILDKMVAMTPREHWRQVVQRIKDGQ